VFCKEKLTELCAEIEVEVDEKKKRVVRERRTFVGGAKALL
jgi:hypothetical protein